MPLREDQDVKVTITIALDGHTLHFEEKGAVHGARYHGKDPREHGYSTDETLESLMRGLVHASIAKAQVRAALFLQRAYPIHVDRCEP